MLFDILTEYFSILPGSRALGALDEPAEEGENQMVADSQVEVSDGGGTSHEVEAENEPHHSQQEEGGESEAGEVAEDPYVEEVGDATHPPTTPQKKMLPMSSDEDDSMNECLAWHMGGDSMLKPTPSPHWPGSDPPSMKKVEELKDIDMELERLE